MEVLGVIVVVLLAVAKVSLFAISVKNALKPKATGGDNRPPWFDAQGDDGHEFPLFATRRS